MSEWTKERVLKERPIFRIQVDGREVVGYMAQHNEKTIYIEYALNGESEVGAFPWDKAVACLNGEGGLYP